MLKLENVSASYGSVPAISNVSIEIGEGEAVGLLGANGAGKSTTLRAISSLVKLTSGVVTLDGTNLAAYPPYRIPELGIAHVPEGRQVFPEMTVNENLEIGSYVPKARAERQQTLELVYSIFPRLAELIGKRSERHWRWAKRRSSALRIPAMAFPTADFIENRLAAQLSQLL